MSRFIAALDQSGGSTPGALDRYGVEYTEDNMMDKIHDMRLRMINAPAFNSDNIFGAILYQGSVRRGMIGLLYDQGIESFLKIDAGTTADGTMKPFHLEERLEWACTKLYGTKMRSVVKRSHLIELVLKQQFKIARTVSEHGLVPIIEPEVEIGNINKAEIELELNKQLEAFLAEVDFKLILKLTPPEVPNLYHNLTLNPNVEKVVFLSGGYPTFEACRRLSLAEGVRASFSRALTEGLNVDQSDNIFNARLALNILQIEDAS